MSTPKFNTLVEGLLNELMPDINPEYTGSGGEVPASFPEKAEGKYALTADEVKKALEVLVADLRAAGGTIDKPYKEYQESNVVDAIKSARPDISGTNAKYAARVLYNTLKEAGIVTDERNGTKLSKAPTPGEEESIADEVSEDVESNKDESGRDEAAAEVSEITQPTAYKAYNKYYIKDRESIPSGTLTTELEPIYTRIEGMAGSEETGEDIENRLRKAGTEPGRIVRYIKELIKANVIEPAESSKTSDDIAALEPGEDNMGDIEQDTFSKLYKHAFKDYQSAGGAPAGGYGGDYED